MRSVSYMGNGSITEFYFNFPYFETSNIVVTVNNAPAPTYNIIGTPGGLDADFPFVGGRVVFDVAPTRQDCVTISRQLPLRRIADYQPMARIEPTTLNQDLNYLMEVIKDKQDELNNLSAQYADIADKESTETLLARISAIHDEIVAIDAKITALGDISTLRTDVTTNHDNIATNTGDIANLRDAANFTATGRAAISHMSMPSANYDELTFGPSGTTYTAPADGWFVIKIDNENLVHHWVNITLNGLFIGNYWGQVANNCFAIPLIPCGKNGTLTIDYGADIKNTSTIKFLYANNAN